jgi:hypothetical protein
MDVELENRQFHIQWPCATRNGCSLTSCLERSARLSVMAWSIMTGPTPQEGLLATARNVITGVYLAMHLSLHVTWRLVTRENRFRLNQCGELLILLFFLRQGWGKERR